MPYILVFKSRVGQETIFGCEAQPHAGRNALFLGVLLAAGLRPAAQPAGFWDLRNRTWPTVQRPEDLNHFFFLEPSAKFFIILNLWSLEKLKKIYLHML